MTEAAVKEARSRTKVEDIAKSYPQWNEDGTPVLDSEGKQVWGPEKMAKPKKEKKARKVKEPEYQKDENGEFILDEQGEKILVVKKGRTKKEPEYEKDENGEFVLDAEGNKILVKKTRAPKLDADGNPIPRRDNTFLPSQVITLTEKGKNTKYREGSNRARHFETIYDGMTVEQYYAANGGKTASHRYLVHQLNVLLTINID
jgi:hypothetical protein